MEEYIAFDSHKRYTWVEHQQANSGKTRQYRLEHAPGAIRQALAGCSPGTSVAIEATANWYWITDELEQAQCVPRLVHSSQSEVDDGPDQQDRQVGYAWAEHIAAQWHIAHGMDSARAVAGAARADANARGAGGATYTLEESHHGHAGEMGFAGERVQRSVWKTRARRTAGPHGAEQTRWATRQMLAQLDSLSEQIREFEKHLGELVEVTPEMQGLETLPGVGVILSATIALEMGEIGRFLSAERLASYSGTVPRVHASGERVRYGRTRPDVNRYLKWAFAQAANSTAVNYRRFPERHVSQLYARLRARKGHNKAVGAVARHLAEAAFHVLSRQQAYRDPTATAGRTSEV